MPSYITIHSAVEPQSSQALSALVTSVLGQHSIEGVLVHNASLIPRQGAIFVHASAPSAAVLKLFFQQWQLPVVAAVEREAADWAELISTLYRSPFQPATAPTPWPESSQAVASRTTIRLSQYGEVSSVASEPLGEKNLQPSSDIPHRQSGEAISKEVPATGFEPVISTLKG